jgi:hypothetical protein
MIKQLTIIIGLLLILSKSEAKTQQQTPYNLPHENRTLVVMVAPSVW